MKIKKLLFLFLIFVFFISTSLFSSNNKLIKTKILNAAKYVDSNKYNLALENLYDAIMFIKNLQTFRIENFNLIEKEFGYRQFIKKATDNLIFKGEPFYVYMEPVGYKIIKTKNGYYLWVSEDAKIIDNKSGKVLFERKDWVSMKRTYPYPTIPFYITNRITDFPSGSYTFIAIIKDHLQNKSVKKVYKFKVK